MALTKLKKIESTDIDTNTPIQSLFSEFVLCQNFVFRIRDVDCFWHAEQPEGPAITAIYLKGYSPHIADPDGKLFRFLCSKLTPQETNEE
jgi:hypothetical protein